MITDLQLEYLLGDVETDPEMESITVKDKDDETYYALMTFARDISSPENIVNISNYITNNGKKALNLLFEKTITLFPKEDISEEEDTSYIYQYIFVNGHTLSDLREEMKVTMENINLYFMDNDDDNELIIK